MSLNLSAELFYLRSTRGIILISELVFIVKYYYREVERDEYYYIEVERDEYYHTEAKGDEILGSS